MLSRTTNRIFRCTYYQIMTKCHNATFASFTKENEIDPAPLFFDNETQQLLRTLTRIDYNKVARVRKEGQTLKTPEYKFMTNEELEKAKQKAIEHLETRLQMPPVVKSWEDKVEVISVEPALQGCMENKLICTDITYGVSDKERIIVVREVDGTLRTANQEERIRMNNIYFPTPGREMEPPKIFDGEYLTSLLQRGEYEHILDRACIQFEPDNPEYQRITHTVYLHVNATKKFDLLRSTRHFGPMVFYLTQMKMIDDVLIDVIGSGKIDEAVSLIRLFHKMHPTTPSATEKCEEGDIALIEHYARLDSNNISIIMKAVNTYKELKKEKEILQENIRKAHGLDVKSDKVEPDV